MSPISPATAPSHPAHGVSWKQELPISLVSLGLAAHAAALTRVHALSAGTVPTPSALVAAGLLLGLALGAMSAAAAAAAAPSSTAPQRRRLLGLLAAAISVAVVLGGPIVLSRAPGWIAAIATASCAVAVGWLTARAGLVDWARPRLGFVALGLGLAGLSLPLLGPLPVALLAALLLAGASLLPSLATDPPEAAGMTAVDGTSADGRWRGQGWAGAAPIVLGLGTGLAFLSLAALLRDQLSSPWPLGFLLAGALVAGLAIGRVAARAIPAIAIAAAILGLGGVVLALNGSLARLAGSLADSLGLNLLEPGGATVALVATAVLLGIPAALVPGLIAHGDLGTRRLAGAALGFAGAGLLASWLRGAFETLFVAAALMAVARLSLLSRSPSPASQAARIATVAAFALSLVLVGTRWWHASPEGGRASRRAGSGWSSTISGQDAEPRTLVIDGQPVATTDPGLAATGRLAGHLAGLLAGEPRHVLVVGWPLPGLLEALSAHRPESITVAEPVPGASSAFADLPGSPGGAVANIRRMGATSPAALPSSTRFDAIVVALPDPTLRHGEAFFTPSGRAELASLLARDGVLVDIMDLGRTTPPDLLARLALLRESLPDPVLFMADSGQRGLLLVAAPSPATPESAAAVSTPAPEPSAAFPESSAKPRGSSAQPHAGEDAAALNEPIRIRDDKLVTPPIVARSGRPFNLARLLAASRLTPEVQASLRAGLILTPAQLMATIVAGGAEIDALGNDAGAFDPWTPGAQALTFAPPPELARPLAQALFHARLQVVDLPVLPGVLPIGSQGRGDQGSSIPFMAIETRLGPEWAVSGRLRYQNRLASFLGSTGVYRDRSRRVSFTQAGQELHVTERPLHSVDLSVLENSMGGLGSGKPLHRGSGEVNGHPALWSFEQPSVNEQILIATWHCPVSQRLFGLRYRVTEGVKPGLFEDVVDRGLGSVRCSHGPAAHGDTAWQPIGQAPTDDSAVGPVPGG